MRCLLARVAGNGAALHRRRPFGVDERLARPMGMFCVTHGQAVL